MKNDYLDYSLWIIGSVLLAMMLGVLVAGILDCIFTKHEIVTLDMRNWACSSTYEERVFSGKVWTVRTSCSQYELKEKK